VEKPMSRRILRLQEISDRTGIPLATLRWYRHRGIGPKTWKLGRRVVAYEDDVDAWVAAQAQGGGREDVPA
jgi:predicted DNA-binding transcriptional regulator AlpA